MPELRLSITWNPKGRQRQDGTGPVVLRINYAGQRVYIDTGYSCKKAKFKKERIIGQPIANQAFGILKQKAQEAYNELLRENQPITAKSIADLLTNKPTADFLTWAKSYIEGRTNIAKSTKAKYNTLFTQLSAFSAFLPFSALTYSKIRQFEAWLSNRETERKTLPSRNYVVSQLRFLRTLAKEAKKQGLLKEYPFEGYRMPKEPTEAIWLPLEQALAIGQVDTRQWKGKLHITKQIWLMQLFTGLRFSDAKEIKAENFYMKDDASLWLKITPAKTAKKSGALVHFCLTGLFQGEAERFILPLLDRRKTGRLLSNNITNKVMNQNLKKLAKAAGINKGISTHSARHSFAMYMLNIEGYSMLSVSGMLGHTDIKTTQSTYARLLPENYGRVRR